MFQDLVPRGLRGVTYVVSDEHVDLVAAVHRYFPDAVHQRCQVHHQRNALAKVSSDPVHRLATRGLRDAWSATTRDEAGLRIARLIDDRRPLAPRLADCMAGTSDATLACYALDRDDIRTELHSTNSLERHHIEVRRRTRVIRIFPHEASLLRVTTALHPAERQMARAAMAANRKSITTPHHRVDRDPRIWQAGPQRGIT